MRANDRRAAEGNLSEKLRRKLAVGAFKRTPQLSHRLSVIVSRPIRLRESVAPIRRVLIFDDHPATIRLLDKLDRAQKRKDRLALVKCGALIVLLILAMFWPLL